MNVVWLLIVGAAAGFLATRLMKWEADIVVTIAVGIAGALVGGWLLRMLLSGMAMMSGLVGAVLGALVLVWLWQHYGPKGDK
jgi:uncharacterized membrane protein YeaQ/YmgE (transglycosylase-associated protein family)